MKLRFFAAAALVCGLLTACGGGGGDAGDSKYGDDDPTTETPTTTASSLILELGATSILNTAATPVTAKVTAVSSAGQTLSDVPVVFEVSNAQYTVTGTKTGSDGSLTASIITSDSKANRVITVKAKAGSVSVSKNIVVSGLKIAATPIPSIIVPGTSGSIEFTVSDANSNAVVDQPIAVTSPFGSAAGNTNNAGKFTYSYNVPSAYANSEFTAVASSGGVTLNQTIAVQLSSGGGVIPPATAAVATSVVEVDPAVVGTNPANSTANSATVRFKAFDSNSLPVRNVRVSFDLAGDPGNVGGTFTSGSNLVYTDSNGIATATYIPGQTATATNGLSIRACYSGSDFSPAVSGNATSGTAACPASRVQPITINNEALNVTIGSDDGITTTQDGLRYVVKYVVQVVNASGQAKANVTITPTLDLLGFEKGFYTWDAVNKEWDQVTTSDSLEYDDPDIPSITYTGCKNEDVNRNAIRDSGEDIDGDTVLEPRKSDAAVSFITTGTQTDATGAIGLQVTYLKNVATWLRVKITVKGSVSGTEGVGTFETVLPAPLEILKQESDPAFKVNPYGAAPSCSTHSSP